MTVLEGGKVNCNRLMTTCNCGSYCTPVLLWITDTKMLLVESVCVSCGEKVNVLFPLTELYKECPVSDAAKGAIKETGMEIVDQVMDEKPKARSIQRQ